MCRRNHGASFMEGSLRVENITSASPKAVDTSSSALAGHSPGVALALVNGVLAGVGGVYAATHSVLITVIAVLAAIVITALPLLLRARPPHGTGSRDQ